MKKMLLVLLLALPLLVAAKPGANAYCEIKPDFDPVWGDAALAYNLSDRIAINMFYTTSDGETVGIPLGLPFEGEIGGYIPDNAVSVKFTGPEKNNPNTTKVFATCSR